MLLAVGPTYCSMVERRAAVPAAAVTEVRKMASASGSLETGTTWLSLGTSPTASSACAAAPVHDVVDLPVAVVACLPACVVLCPVASSDGSVRELLRSRALVSASCCCLRAAEQKHAMPGRCVC